MFLPTKQSPTKYGDCFVGKERPPRNDEVLCNLLNQLHCLFCLVFKKIGVDLISFLPGFERAVVIAFAIQSKAIP